MNASFEQHTPIEILGEGIVIALPSPRNLQVLLSTSGPLTASERSLQLLSSTAEETKQTTPLAPVRVASREEEAVQTFIWAQCMLVTMTTKQRWDYHKTGSDVFEAFDTNKRKQIRDVLLQAGSGEEKLRFVQPLLTSTRLRVPVNSEMSASFKTTV